MRMTISLVPSPLPAVIAALAAAACQPAQVGKGKGKDAGAGGSSGNLDAEAPTDVVRLDREIRFDVMFQPDRPPTYFAANVYPLITIHCQACHGTVADPLHNNLPFPADPDASERAILEHRTPCATVAEKRLAVPGNPDDSYLMKKLVGHASICKNGMPEASGVWKPMAASDIQVFRTWILGLQ